MMVKIRCSDGRNEINHNHNDSKQLLYELHSGGFTTHRSCWRHLAAHRQGGGKMSEMEMKEMKLRFAPCFLIRGACRKRSERKVIQPEPPRSKMNETIFKGHLENLWRTFPDDKTASFTHVESWCFNYYLWKGPKAFEHIKHKNIFSKKYTYVFVPVVCWDHWRLLVFCHFGEDAGSKTRTRCILLLDSAESCAQTIGPDVRKFVFDMFKAERRPDTKDAINQIPLLVPKVPQQANGVDCGRFVLYYIKLFIEKAPQNFSTTNGYPYFLKRDWFDPKSFSKFCDYLERDIPTENEESGAPRRCSQRIRKTRSSSQEESSIILFVD